jgi:hypothetical protein
MRAGPLSDARVIELLNGHFVCLFTSNDEILGERDFVKREAAERQKKILEFHHAKLGTGSVTVYILSADGRPLHRQGVVKATENKDNLFNLLQKVVADLKLAKGEPVIKPAPQAVQPQVKDGALLLHLAARKLTPKYSWNEFPSENWLVLSAEEARKLLPEKLEAAATHKVDSSVAAKMLTLFFPQTEICTADESKLLSASGPYRHRLDEHALRASVISRDSGVVRCRLEGRLKLRHDFYPNMPKSENVVEGEVVGYLDYDVTKKQITTLRLVTDQAALGKTPFGVAVRSVP